MALFGFLLFFVLNRTTVVGRHRVPDERNTLLLCNHQSMIDSWLVGLAAFYPQTWWKPHLLPWNPAAEENFYSTPMLRLLSDLWRVIPIREGRRDIKALYRMTRALEGGVMILFPEGTRTRDGSVGEGRAGAGLVTLGTRPTVIPVAIDGMQDVLPIGSHVPRIGKEIHVYFGEPLEYDDLKDLPRSKETAQKLVDRGIERLREQLAEIREGGASG
jgi:1-acyl-sn-glycerol-3-phosphate acyltransferase